MTQWVEHPNTGRERGVAGLLRAWVALLVRPQMFFTRKIAPGDQAPGLTFAATAVLVAETSRLLVFGGSYPVVGGQPVASAVVWVLALAVLVAPAAIHLTAALQTVILMATVDDRAGISETVQVICYSFAPTVFMGAPSIWVRSLALLWAVGLFVVGLARVHEISLQRAAPIAAVPAVFVFGYGFGGTDALTESARVAWSTIEALVG